MALFLLNDWSRDDLGHIRFDGLDLSSDNLFSPYRRFRNYIRPRRLDTTNIQLTVQNDENKFQVSVDVQQFKPDEVQVKVIDNSVVVEGKHEEKQDEHGYISRQFTRRYILPKECQMKNVASTLSSNGVLTITAPKMSAIKGAQERVIPIMKTGPYNSLKNQL